MFSGSQMDGGSTLSQSTQAVDSTPSPAKSRDSLGLVPVTVKQISQASQSGDEKTNFTISGVEVTNVALVGMVFDKAEKVTDIGFTLDDGTGRIGCKRWVNETFDTMEMEIIEEGMYVRVNGHLKSFQGVRQLVAFSVRPVKNFDEVTFHFIECIHFNLQNSKLHLRDLLSTPSVVPESTFNTPVRGVPNGFQSSQSSQVSINSAEGLKDCDQLVLDYLQQSSNMGQERGIHRDELHRQLKLPMDKIKEIIKSLEDDGLIYSTIDEFHFKPT